MLSSIHIQNFRSIRDASVKLGQVNLFIGPNNSGKSNFLKGIEFAANWIANYPERQEVPLEWYNQSLPRENEVDLIEPPIMTMQLHSQLSENNFCEVNLSVQGNYDIVARTSNIRTDLKAAIINSLFNTREELDLRSITTKFPAFPQEFYRTREYLKGIVIYKPDPTRLNVASQIRIENRVSSDASNTISFLYNLRENYRRSYQQLEKSFARCVGTLETMSMPPNPESSSTFKLKFFDRKGIGYWAEEVSEGVLYFLALLCIVYQPDPPKLLLLEEPEKGIHPRRIKEVMEFIFELARLRDIQIILTSHSPYVVDHFADIPECISVFDRVDGETVIHNAADIIQKTNEEYAAQGLPPSKYTDSLGEYWVSGFLGGVPV